MILNFGRHAPRLVRVMLRWAWVSVALVVCACSEDVPAAFDGPHDKGDDDATTTSAASDTPKPTPRPTGTTSQGQSAPSPGRVTGTLAKPTFTPDAEALAQMKLKSLLPTASDPGKLSSAIIGAFSGKGGVTKSINDILGGGQQQRPQQNGEAKKQQPATPADAVQSILDAFGGKKQKR